MMVSKRINAERIVLFGWSRAILLQLAHPLVAAGVAEHSTFRAGPVRAAQRLHHTVRAMTRLTFGTPAEHQTALAGILDIHRRVHGVLRTSVGPFPAGTTYSAEDPALVLWVHATLLESLPLVYELLVAPLSVVDRDAYCRESAGVARALGAGDEVPQSWDALTAYLAAMHASGQIVVGPDARAVAGAVLSPAFGPIVAPARRANRLITTQLMPPTLREAYALPWAPVDQRASVRWARRLRMARRLTPTFLREWPEARARAQ